jgi:hypothetical protein
LGIRLELDKHLVSQLKGAFCASLVGNVFHILPSMVQVVLKDLLKVFQLSQLVLQRGSRAGGCSINTPVSWFMLIQSNKG